MFSAWFGASEKGSGENASIAVATSELDSASTACPYQHQQQQQQLQYKQQESKQPQECPVSKDSPLYSVLQEQIRQQQADGRWVNGETEVATSTGASNTTVCPLSKKEGCSSNASADPLLSTANHAPLTFVEPSAESEPAGTLPTRRQVSSIPRTVVSLREDTKDAKEKNPEEFWVYPSQQQFYEAMKRKNYEPKEEDMAVIVPLHNVVNEMAWRKVMKWEEKYRESCGDIRLKRFQGKPTELSVKARIKNFFGYQLPFDRHDWVVDRCGKEVRYVIDFYEGRPDQQQKSLINIHIDARPAIESAETAWDRFVDFLMD